MLRGHKTYFKGLLRGIKLISQKFIFLGFGFKAGSYFGKNLPEDLKKLNKIYAGLTDHEKTLFDNDHSNFLVEYMRLHYFWKKNVKISYKYSECLTIIYSPVANRITEL